MAETFDFRIEEMIPELENMVVALFDKDEIQAIHNMRKDYENKILRTIKRKDDFIKYINFETQFLRMLELRYKKKGPLKSPKMSDVKLAVGRRLHRLFVLTIRSFPRDLRLWLAYIKFCHKKGFGSAASRVLDHMLEQHGHSKPELFKLAARIELTDCKNIEKSRKYLLEGIHLHKDNKPLLIEAFRLELIDADMKRKELEAKNLPIDKSNIHLTAKKAESIYDSGIKNLKDVELMNDLMNICAEYDFATELEDKIYKELCDRESNERMWDIIATRELHLSDGKSTPKARLKKCVALYEEGATRLNTAKMWEYYLDALIELAKKAKPNEYPNFKRNLLLSALQQAAVAGKLTEKYYLVWVSYLQGPEKHKRLVEVLQGAVKKLPDSVTLWLTLLGAHLTKGEDKQANHVFEQGVAALTKHSLPLWKLMLQFEQLKRNNKVEELFKKGCIECPEISGPLRPMYLEWMVLTHGIVVARKVYESLCELPSPTLEMHKKMIYLESIQATIKLRKIRDCYLMACIQFGETDVDVWLDHCKFEINNGGLDKASEIYWRARKNLSFQKFETFSSELAIITSQSPLELER